MRRPAWPSLQMIEYHLGPRRVSVSQSLPGKSCHDSVIFCKWSFINRVTHNNNWLYQNIFFPKN
jgi:hypothetical protein